MPECSPKVNIRFSYLSEAFSYLRIQFLGLLGDHPTPTPATPSAKKLFVIASCDCQLDPGKDHLVDQRSPEAPSWLYVGPTHRPVWNKTGKKKLALFLLRSPGLCHRLHALDSSSCRASKTAGSHRRLQGASSRPAVTAGDPRLSSVRGAVSDSSSSVSMDGPGSPLLIL